MLLSIALCLASLRSTLLCAWNAREYIYIFFSLDLQTLPPWPKCATHTVLCASYTSLLPSWLQSHSSYSQKVHGWLEP